MAISCIYLTDILHSECLFPIIKVYTLYICGFVAFVLLAGLIWRRRCCRISVHLSVRHMHGLHWYCSRLAKSCYSYHEHTVFTTCCSDCLGFLLPEFTVVGSRVHPEWGLQNRMPPVKGRNFYQYASMPS